MGSLPFAALVVLIVKGASAGVHPEGKGEEFAAFSPFTPSTHNDTTHKKTQTSPFRCIGGRA